MFYFEKEFACIIGSKINFKCNIERGISLYCFGKDRKKIEWILGVAIIRGKGKGQNNTEKRCAYIIRSQLRDTLSSQTVSKGNRNN